MKKRIGVLLVILLLLPVSFSAALTADEYFEFASGKYLEGNNRAALSELNKALAVDPNHKGAQQLKAVIEQELILDRSPLDKVLSSPSAVKQAEPKAAPAPPTVIREKLIERIIERPVPASPIPKAEEKKRGIDDVLYTAVVFGAALSFLVLVLLVQLLAGFMRSFFTYCSECHTRNSKKAEFCSKCETRLIAPELTEEQKMWLEKFGWKKNPFTLNVKPDVYAGHKIEIRIIIEKLNTLSGHVLILGGLGTGKTTLLQWLEKHLKNRFETIYLLRPPCHPDELIDLISATISNNTKHTRKYSVYQFRDLCKNYKRKILLLLDEAHELNESVEQFIRTLGDLPNVFFVMSGLPQTREMLKNELPALFDRIVESILLGALSREETRELIEKRISDAGGKGISPFTSGAIDKIYELGYGIPRGILKICDWVITRAVRENKISVDVNDVVAYNEEMKHLKPEEPKEVQQ